MKSNAAKQCPQMWQIAQMWDAQSIHAELKIPAASLQLLYATGIIASRNRI
jgi:hypothetical protein